MTRIFAILMALTMAAGQLGAIGIDAEKVVEMALATNEEVRMADNSTRQADLRKGVALTAYLPRLSGSATVGWMLPDTKYDEMALTMRMRGMYMAGISITQPIFAGGKIVAANKMAAIGKDAAAEQRRMTREHVAADAEISYWSYVAVCAKVDMMKSYVALLDTALLQTKTAVEAGMATENDLLRIEARQSQAVYQLESVMAGADLCRMALCNTIGIDTATELTTADGEIALDIPSDLYSYSIDNRAEMKLMDADIKIKEQQVVATRGDYLPTLGFQAGWSAYGNINIKSMAAAPDGSYVPVSQNIANNGFNFMFSLQVPLFHWGEGIKKVKEKRIDVENARLDRQNTAKKLDLQVENAIAEITTGRQLLNSAEHAMAQAEASLQSETKRYDIGLSTLTDLLDAQSQWQNARASLIEARTQLRIHAIEYRLATATLGVN